jgi:hypothetical protein
MKHSILFLTLIISGLSTIAQTTGSFKLDVTFDEADYQFTRSLYFYVPSDYDEKKAYKLVVGFRGGPHTNAGQFRDQLTFFSDSIGAIIVCPENAGHFNNKEGLVKQLFRYTVDTTKAMYNIDDDFIYLTGLSYGGRHAVIVSMDTDNGPIPKLRGVIPFATGSKGHLEPDYQDIDDFSPACICIGLNDNTTFINVANTLHSDIILNGGSALLNEISGVGHTVEFTAYPSEMMECLNYIETQNSTSSIPDIQRKDIKIFPNPSGKKFGLSIPKSIQPIEGYLMDATGKTIMRFENYHEIDVSNIANGIKTLVLVTKESVFTRQLSVVH